MERAGRTAALDKGQDDVAELAALTLSLAVSAVLKAGIRFRRSRQTSPAPPKGARPVVRIASRMRWPMTKRLEGHAQGPGKLVAGDALLAGAKRYIA